MTDERRKLSRRALLRGAGVAGAAVTRERRFADGAIALTLESGVYHLQMRC